MKLIVAIVCSLLSITLAQQCQIETCEDLENALVEAEKQVEVLVEENQRATQKQKRLQDKLRQLNVSLSLVHSKFEYLVKPSKNVTLVVLVQGLSSWKTVCVMPRITRSKRTTSWSISNSAFHGL